MDNIAVKDPSIVFFGDRYHLFYTAKSLQINDTDTLYRTGCGYVSAPTLDGLQNAERISIDSLAGCPVIAPQVFYFEPLETWYLLGQTPGAGQDLSRLTPVYLTNPDIGNPSGWSRAKALHLENKGIGFWIDFWVICDDQHAHLFFSDQEGSVYRVTCGLDEFPAGLSGKAPVEAIRMVDTEGKSPWRLFEAVHIYYVRSHDHYMALLEGAYPHPSREGDVDARNRFIFGMTADSLTGRWERMQPGWEEFLAEAGNLIHPGGERTRYTMVSHPELLRSGYNQRLAIDDYKLTMIFQGFDGTAVPDNYLYNALPWELVVMSNHGQDQTLSEEDFTLSREDYSHWTIDRVILEPGDPGTFDELAVKDPTIVYYKGNYHLFYTGKASYETRDRLTHLSKNGSGLGYVSAPTLEELGRARRYDMGRITGSVIVAPQVFYFEPHRLWYLVAQTVVEGKPDLMPVYMTNRDIGDVSGWTAPTILETGKSHNGFWIDFWVICDDRNAHLFYTDHAGSLFRLQCPLGEFPHGFKNAREETVLTERGENRIGRWRMHEASHIYFVREHGHYLNIMEAVYPHPTRAYYWDSRNRFLFGMVADKLEGPWRRIEMSRNEFLGDPASLFTLSGEPSIYDQVSHPELIRAGYDQKLEIEDYNLQLLFQAFDADTTGPEYDYNYLPWKLILMRNL